VSGQSSATPWSVRTRKSDGRSRGHTALYKIVPPPTPLKLPSTMSDDVKSIG
jgi:hypothetical protein